jgi:hypothetical protein
MLQNIFTFIFHFFYVPGQKNEIKGKAPRFNDTLIFLGHCVILG